MNNEIIINNESIKNKIHYIRGKYVMLDRDLAKLYEVETRILNQAVKRNIERFPEDFMFQLNQSELISLRKKLAQDWISQNVIPNSNKMGLRIKPLAFTEQGVATLSGILKSKKAIEVNIKIIRAFISMRKFLIKNQNIIQKFQQIDEKFIEHDKNFEKVFDYMSLNEPKQGVFFNGQIFDAYHFISKLIKKSKNEIILIDNYIDEEILQIFTKTNVKIFRSNKISKHLYIT